MADVVAFYQREFPAMGWVEDPDFHIAVSNSVSMMFAKDDQTMGVTVNGDTSDTTSVMMFTYTGE